MSVSVTLLRAKLHRIRVTEACRDYVGSLTLDEDLMDAVGIFNYERILVANVENGERFETYVIKGERGSGCICLNGAAARRVQVGDVVIIISYALMDFEEAKQFKPTIVFPKEGNKV
jgi:aspartate 1-decarboxylase